MVRMRSRCALALALLVLLPASGVWAGQETELIPREVLFGNPQRAGVEISPDGSKISYLAPVDGVLNVWVGPVKNPAAAKPVTRDTGRGVRNYFWAYTNDHIVCLQDKDGDENWRAYVVDVKTGVEKDLTPVEGVRANIEGVSHRFPKEILIGLNDRDPRLHDLYRIDLETGERTLVEENTGFMGYVSDDSYTPRLAARIERDGSMKIERRNGDGTWEPYLAVPSEDNLTTSPMGVSEDGKTVYMRDSRGRNTTALVALDLETGASKLLAEDPRADVVAAMVHPTKNHVQAVQVDYTRAEWRILDPSIKGDFAALEAVDDGDFWVISRTLDDRTWIVAFYDDDGPTRYYRYDRGKKKAHYLFSNRPQLEGLELASMHPVVIESRDGLELVSYLSLPPTADADGDGRPAAPMPMVLFVHGGPWSRDSWGYNSWHQWLTNRGYAVLSVNYRGSTGFGKDFLNAANKQWSAKMHDDLIDAVDWAIAEKIADPDRVAIAGGSYGGYATLVGLTFTPDRFACGVDIVGPSNLITLIRNAPAYWRPFMPAMMHRLGDPSTLEGRRYLRSISPLTHVEEITKPLLIGQGANDPRVTQVESDQIVEAMLEKDLPVTYVLYPDEGHGFRRPENQLSFNAVTEAFLAQHLGGRYEPIGDALEGSTIEVPTGAEHVPGLAEALMQRTRVIQEDRGR